MSMWPFLGTKLYLIKRRCIICRSIWPFLGIKIHDCRIHVCNDNLKYKKRWMKPMFQYAKFTHVHAHERCTPSMGLAQPWSEVLFCSVRPLYGTLGGSGVSNYCHCRTHNFTFQSSKHIKKPKCGIQSTDI